MQNIWIPNNLFIPCQSSNTLTSSNNCIALLSAHGLNKRHRRERTSEGLTNNIQRVRDCRSKRLQCQLNSESNYIKFDWVELMSKDYFQVIDAINDCGKCNKVFRLDHDGLPDILNPKSRINFFYCKEKHTFAIQSICWNWCTKTHYVYWCWNRTGSKQICKLQQANAFSKRKSCKGTDSWAWISNQQPKHCQMKCVPGMSYTE